MTTPRRRRHARGWGREPPRKQLFAEVSFPLALLQSTTPSTHDPPRRLQAGGALFVVTLAAEEQGTPMVVVGRTESVPQLKGRC